MYYKLIEDAVIDLVQDPLLKDHIDWEAKPIYKHGQRVFGPFRSGMWMEAMEIKFGDRTVIALIGYSDATEFYKGVSAHPIFGKSCVFCACPVVCLL